MPTCSQHVELILYADYMAIIGTSRKPTLHVSYLDSYLSDLLGLVSECRFAINVPKNSAVIFARSSRHFIQTRSFTPCGEPIQWIDTALYLRIPLEK